ncbi:MAG TPA: hypothetical protein VMH87_13120 [Pseudomonadales bacterium]|nr:hypothetical protein [Pseudomonadales bacterium]
MKPKKLTQNRLIAGTVCTGAILLMAAGARGQNLFVSTLVGDNIVEIAPGGSQSNFATGMYYPTGIAFNSSGDLFVANSALDAGLAGNITEITPNGTPSTFASGIDPKAVAVSSSGNVFEADYHSGFIYEYTPSGVRSTFAAGFAAPECLTFDSMGDLYVGAGYGNGNGYITKIAPNGTQTSIATGLSFPSGLAFNSAGDLFDADGGDNTIFEFTPGGAKSTFVSGLSGLSGLAIDGTGNLYATSGSGPIYKITPGGTESTITTISGNPFGIAVQPVPEPSIFGLFVGGLASLLMLRRSAFRKIGCGGRI